VVVPAGFFLLPKALAQLFSMKSVYVWLLTACIAALAMFQHRPWKPLEVFNADEGGYYAYLPSAFIYGDLGRADSLATLQKAQMPPLEREMGLRRQPNGKVISKYWLGTALGNMPWFWGAHWYAGLTHKNQDGFSRPYQQAMMVAGLVYALLGLWVVRLLLRLYFDDRSTAWALAGVGLGTNFLAYASYNAAMAHAPLFMWQAALVYCTARWYQRPQQRFGLGMGLFLGLAVLVRPSEALFGLVPLTWGLSSGAAVRQRPRLLWAHKGTLAGAALLGLAVVSLQLLFWHAAVQQWWVNSYGDEGFDFARPHVLEGLFSFRKGWLLYTPLAAVALLGLWPLRRRVPAAVAPVLLLLPVLLVVTFSWEQWWYGGGFSARALISCYPLLALPLAAWVANEGRRAVAKRCLLIVCVLLNLWQTYQYAAGIIYPDKYTSELYFRNFFRAKL